MKKNLTSSLLFLCLLLTSGPVCCQTLKEVRFDNMVLHGKLPYQEPFFIRGNRNVFKGKGEVAILKIEKCTNDACTSLAPPTSYFWWLKGTESDFEFYINQGLEFGAKYKLTFDFYAKKENTPIKEEIKKRALPELQLLYDQAGGISLNQVETKLKEVVNAVVASNKVGTLTILNGKITFDTNATSQVDFSKSNFELLANIIRENNSHTRADRELKAAVANIKLFRTNTWTDLQQTLATVQSNNKRVFTSGMLNEISEFLNSLVVPQYSTVEKVRQYSILGRAYSANLGELIDLIETYENKNQELIRLTESVKNLNGKYATSIDLVVEDLYAGVGNGVVIEAKSDVFTLNDLQTIRFGVVVGAGVAITDPLDSHESNPFSYVAVKYFLQPTDKRVPDKYLGTGVFKRFSLLAGWKISGTLKYQGTEMHKVIGLNPILGISYDLNPWISLDGLAMFFNEPSVSPMETSDRLRVAPCISLSIDLDLLNRFRSLASDQSYKIPAP